MSIILRYSISEAYQACKASIALAHLSYYVIV